jgi:hypothetical protein
MPKDSLIFKDGTIVFIPAAVETKTWVPDTPAPSIVNNLMLAQSA